MEKVLLIVTVLLGVGVVVGFGALFMFTGSSKKDLTYTHLNPNFSISFPEGYERGLADGETVARFELANDNRIPNFSIRVYDPPNILGATPDLILSRLPGEYSDMLKSIYPTISDMSITENQVINLSDGYKAIAWKLKWKWTDEVTYLQSAAVAGIKDNKVVTCFGTDLFSEDKSADPILNQCKKLMFNAPQKAAK